MFCAQTHCGSSILLLNSMQVLGLRTDLHVLRLRKKSNSTRTARSQLSILNFKQCNYNTSTMQLHLTKCCMLDTRSDTIYSRLTSSVVSTFTTCFSNSMTSSVLPLVAAHMSFSSSGVYRDGTAIRSPTLNEHFEIIFAAKFFCVLLHVCNLCILYC